MDLFVSILLKNIFTSSYYVKYSVHVCCIVIYIAMILSDIIILAIIRVDRPWKVGISTLSSECGNNTYLPTITDCYNEYLTGIYKDVNSIF